MATYGTAVYRANGTTPLINQGLSGGSLYLDTIEIAAGGSTSRTYPDVPGGSYIRVMLVQAGAHSYTIGTNGSGQATLSVNYTATSSGTTVLFVFATQTTEPTYGISLINDAGERLVSGIFPVPEFLGAVTTTFGGASGISGYWSASTSLGAGRKRMILWKIPDTTDTGFQGTCYVSDTVTGSYSVMATAYGSDTLSAAPVAYVFAVTGLNTGTESYGIRVYNASGGITFDSGKGMLALLKSQTYNNSDSMTVSQMSGITPLILLPSPTAQYGSSSMYFAGYDTITGEPLYGYIYFTYVATLRKNGTTLYSVYKFWESGSGWTPNDYFNGQDTGLVTIVSDSAYY